MRTFRHDLVEALVVIIIFTAVGMGPLYALGAVAGGFLDPEDPRSWGASLPVIYLLAIVLIGYFFGWTMTNLAVDFEAFWRLPGRLRAFEALVVKAGPGSALHAAANCQDGAVGALRYPRLRSHGVNVLAMAPLTFAYVAVRGAWLASCLAAVSAAIELGRTAVSGESTSASLTALVASLLVFGAASLLTRVLAIPAASQAVTVIGAGSATRR
ncbi:MAG: hypothetical protein OXO54_09335 [Chloroflexota bacterium]|nr:hypothetical protein [Chloroflexota bacterium]MDE2898512.1 hypothetical protein [Chloroflexota bacterium]